MTIQSAARLAGWALLGLLLGCQRDLATARNQSSSSSTGACQTPQLTAEGQSRLQGFIQNALDPDLQRPNFAEYRGAVQKFYTGFDGRLPWVCGEKPTLQASAVIRALENAQYKGLRPADYDADRWNQRLASIATPGVSQADLVRFDLALTVSAMRYLSDLDVGRANPGRAAFGVEVGGANLDLADFVSSQLVNSPNVDASLEAVEPSFPIYLRTEAALKTYLDLAQRDDGEQLPPARKPVKPGDSYPGVPRLVRLLKLLGDLPQTQDVTGDVYRASVASGVKHFQQRHGLEPNGLLDAPTIRELNTPLSRRVVQLQLTLERIRWLPHRFARPPIVVNIPEFRLHADDDQYHWLFSMKVVVGKAYGHQTPVFISQIDSVIFRPYWDVPYSIVRAEMIPHIEKDPSYLAANSYEIVDSSGRVVGGPADQKIVQQLRAGDLRMRQTPGPKNSLGLIKFNIPSNYDVYMHGTPATELFSRSRRDFSHGCIRVEDPVKLAEWVLQDLPDWNEEKIREAMNGSETFRVKLPRPVPVLIAYGTAIVMEDGEVRFFDDVYQQDAALERALAEDRPYDLNTSLPAE